MTKLSSLARVLLAEMAEVAGTSRFQPQMFANQSLAPEESERILRLPAQRVAGVQVTDPASPDFGKFVFLPGYDRLSD